MRVRVDRVLSVGQNAARQLLPSAGQLLVAWLVITSSGEEAWGRVVAPMVVASVLSQLLAWGSRDLLLREFAERPADAGTIWFGNVLARSIGLLPAAGAVWVATSSFEEFGWWCLWLVARFVGTSFDPVVLGFRRFGVALVAEGTALGVTAAVVASPGGAVEATWIAMALAAGATVRALCLVPALGHHLVRIRGWSVDLRSLVVAAPFVMVNLVGTVNSKVDLWLVTAMSSSQEVARYHILSNLLLALQAVAPLAIAPFARSLYRMPSRALRQLTITGLGWGLPASLAAVVAVIMGLRSAYGFDLSMWHGVAAVVVVLPVFGYLPRIYLLFKYKRERAVAVTTLAAALVNGACTAFLVPRLGILGALVGTGFAQVFQFGLLMSVTAVRGDDRDPLS